uniref:Uncharacterized protein n=1 Tax=Streptomyces sp. NBC_00093 TaxID=2975649 RepID=A0AAU2ACD0_9ACTN
MVVHAPPLAGAVSGFGDLLYTVKEVLRNQGLVTAFELFVLVGDPAAVVVVAENAVQPVGGDPAFFGMSRVARHAQPTVVQLLGHLFYGVLTSGVQLERQADERAAYRVDDDGANLAIIDDLNGVQVADRGAGDCAAVLCLLPHLVLDVLGALAGGVLIDHGQHAVQHAAGGGVVDVLLHRRDQPDAELLQGGDHDRVIQPVPGEAAEHVDDHVAHVGVFAQVGNHRLELGALVDRCCRPPGIDELCCFCGAEFNTPLMNLFALRRD